MTGVLMINNKDHEVSSNCIVVICDTYDPVHHTTSRSQMILPCKSEDQMFQLDCLKEIWTNVDEEMGVRLKHLYGSLLGNWY